jgi:hypothetical protein
MDTITAGTQQIATWSTGDIVIYLGALGLFGAGVACLFMGRAIMAFVSVVLGIAVAAGALGLARSVYGFFHSASLEQPASNHAFASLTVPTSGTPYRVLVASDGTIKVVT